MIKILFIEDNKSLIRAFKGVVREAGTTCRTANTYDQAEKLLLSNVYDCVILSADLSEEGGLYLLKMLRNTGRKEIIMLTAKHQTRNIAEQKGFSFDDYLYKPYEPHELYTRIKLQIRKKLFGDSDHPTQFGTLIIDPESRLTYIAQQRIPLTRKETLILFFLLINRNRVVSTKAIYEQLSTKDAQYENNFGTVYEYIKNLKKKLSAFEYPDCISNIKGVGYRFEWNDNSARVE